MCIVLYYNYRVKSFSVSYFIFGFRSFLLVCFFCLQPFEPDVSINRQHQQVNILQTAWNVNIVSEHVTHKQKQTKIQAELKFNSITCSIISTHRRSHLTGCTGPDPTNFWKSIMGPTQYCVAKY